jgi:DHA2 family multidrug resistance protein-like MFS transporter
MSVPGGAPAGAAPAGAPKPESDGGLPLARRIWAIATVALAIVMAVLDGSIANVALPTIARSVAAPPADAIWVVNAYQLAITVALLPLASLGEIWGYARVYRLGLALFVAASLACALSHSLLSLSLARIVQGFGAAGIMSVNTALVRFIYPRRALGRGIGFNALIVAVSAAVGPSVAAAILSVASWPWLFLVNLPTGILALLLSRSLPRTPRAAHPFDWRSALLNALAFGLLVAALDGLGHGERRWLVALELAAAAAAAVALVRRQLPQRAPLLPVDLLRIPAFALSVSTSVCSFAAQMLAYVALPFYLQDALGRGAVETGLLMTPWPLALAVMAPLAGRLADRYPAGLLGGIGLILFAGGLGALALLPPAPTGADIAWRMALTGLGFGLFQSPNNRAIVTAAPPERSGGASGMLATARLLGQTTGAALAALVFGLLPQAGARPALFLAAGVAATAAAVSLVRLAAPASAPG